MPVHLATIPDPSFLVRLVPPFHSSNIILLDLGARPTTTGAKATVFTNVCLRPSNTATLTKCVRACMAAARSTSTVKVALRLCK
jgi:hypothetical protein